MSLYPVSTYNIGTGLNNGGLFDSLGTAVLTDQTGNIIATLNNGVITFVGPSIFNSDIYVNATMSVGNGTGTSGQYLVSTGPTTAPQWITLTVGNGTLSISNGTHITGSVSFTANQTGNSSITIGTDATDSATGGTIVARDSLGNFFANEISGTITNVFVSTASGAGLYFPTFCKGATHTENLYANSVLKFDLGTGNLYSTTFTGSLTGLASVASRSVLLDTNTATAGTYYPTFANAGTGAQGKTIYVDVGISYNSSTDTLTTTNFSGLASNATVAVRSNTIDITATGSTIYQVALSLSSGTSKVLYNSPIFYFDTTTQVLTVPNIAGNITSATFADRANTIDLTSDNTSGSYYIPFSKTTAGTGKTLYIDDTTTPLTYSPTTSTLTATNFVGTASTSNAITLTSDNTSGIYYIPFSKTVAGTSRSLYVDDTTGPLQYNPSTGTITALNFSGTASIATRSITLNTTGSISTSTFYIPFAPVNTTATGQTIYTDANATDISYALSYTPNPGILSSTIHQFPDADTAGGKNWQVNSGTGGKLLFNNFWSSGNYPFQLDGTTGIACAITNNAYLDGNTPTTSVELDTRCAQVNNYSGGSTFNDGIAYMSTTANDYTSLATIGYGTGTATGSTISYTVPVYADNPNGRVLHLATSFGIYCYMFSLVNRTFTYNLSGFAVSMTRNGSAFTNFYFSNPWTAVITRTYTITGNAGFNVYDPLLNLDVYWQPTANGQTTDTYVITFTYTNSQTAAPAGGTFQSVALSTYNYNILNPSVQGSVRTTGTGTFAFGGAALVVPQTYSFTKTLATTASTLNGTYLNCGYLNLVYTSTFTNTSGRIEPLCFSSAYNTHRIVFWFGTSIVPAAYNQLLSFQLVDNTGFALASNYNGTYTSLGTVYTGTAWATTAASVCLLVPSATAVYTVEIQSASQARFKTVNGVNVSGTNYNSSTTSGMIRSTTAYFSLIWAIAGGTVNGNVQVFGLNLK